MLENWTKASSIQKASSGFIVALGCPLFAGASVGLIHVDSSTILLFMFALYSLAYVVGALVGRFRQDKDTTDKNVAVVLFFTIRLLVLSSIVVLALFRDQSDSLMSHWLSLSLLSLLYLAVFHYQGIARGLKLAIYYPEGTPHTVGSRETYVERWLAKASVILARSVLEFSLLIAFLFLELVYLGIVPLKTFTAWTLVLTIASIGVVSFYLIGRIEAKHAIGMIVQALALDVLGILVVIACLVVSYLSWTEGDVSLFSPDLLLAVIIMVVLYDIAKPRSPVQQLFFPRQRIWGR